MCISFNVEASLYAEPTGRSGVGQRWVNFMY
jgi:hypothetical protein